MLSLLHQLHGGKERDMKREVESLMQGIELTGHRNVRAAALSAGMKRRLSILAAFVGPTKVNMNIYKYRLHLTSYS